MDASSWVVGLHLSVQGNATAGVEMVQGQAGPGLSNSPLKGSMDLYRFMVMSIDVC